MKYSAMNDVCVLYPSSGKQNFYSKYLQKLTKRPIPCEHVSEVGDDVECGVHDVSYGEIHNEVVGDGTHPGV